VTPKTGNVLKNKSGNWSFIYLWKHGNSKQSSNIYNTLIWTPSGVLKM